MSKMKLFDDDSEEEVSLKTENEYAKKYNAWREKEEIHKLEQKYGTKDLNSDGSSDSEDESDEPPEVNEELEKQFLKTLALLKTKDPRIYDSNYKFFDDKEEKQPLSEKETKIKTLTFADSDDDDDDDDGNIFTIEKKAEIQDDKAESGKKNKKDEKLKDFLTGKVEHIDDEVEKDLEPLKALWSDPKLSEGEAFLRDYILNKRYLEDGDAGDAEDKLRDDEDLEADEKMVEEQGKFERAYNFRFEEPDEEYLKRFPRTMNYIRPKDDKRSRKRAEVRARKEEEKKKKMEEIARLKALKLKEIQQKIARIKEVTGNDDLAFKEEDIEGDFDPEEHDRRMRAIFDEQYYGEVDDQKPMFPDLDEELEIENWENYDLEQNKNAQDQDGDGPHCEDDDFNMDADYDPKQARTNLLEEIQRSLGKKRRNRKKKSKLGQLLTIEKPKFIPTVADKTYNEYMEEYYNMDCEDVIGGDLPTRFKYREVVPNDFGLTVEEILLADDKELTQWVPLKKIVKHRPENVEKGDVKTYRQRAQDERLKRKMLPSLYKHLPEEPEIVEPIAEATIKKKKNKKNKNHENDKQLEETKELEGDVNNDVETNTDDVQKKKVKKHKEHETVAEIIKNNVNNKHNDSDVQKKIVKKHKEHETVAEIIENNVNNKPIDDTNVRKKKKKKMNKQSNKDPVISENVTDIEENKINNEMVDVHNNVTKDNSSKRRKNKHKGGFNVENIRNVEPSQQSHAINFNVDKSNTDEETVQKVMKRKLNSNAEIPVPSKKKKNKHHKESKVDANSKYVTTKKFKQKNKFKKQDPQSSQNPYSKLSDERLKAYGLNPKKYKNFLKFKKF